MGFMVFSSGRIRLSDILFFYQEIMEVNVTIQESKIYEDVYAITANTGKALDNIDKLSLTEDEMKIVQPLMKESAAELSDVISSYATLSFGEGEISIDFDLPVNWKDAALTTLTQCLTNYISNSICQRWFAMTNRDDVKYYADKVVVNATNIKKLLCERKKPQR